MTPIARHPIRPARIAAVSIGLALSAILGWWWVDPVIGPGLAGLAVREGREAWRGKDCC